MTKTEFYHLLVQDFPHTATNNQDMALQRLTDFVMDDTADSLFLLKGYAGTGKTTIIGTLVKNLWKVFKSSVLLAPTGRAAKVISNYSGREASTIHRRIYYPKKARGGKVNFTLQKNKSKNTIFIVDEASMIPDRDTSGQMFDSSSLLDDLITYVDQGINCKLILIGDTAQLPPVKLDISPALDKHTLETYFDKNVMEIELNEVVRQELNSGILVNATEIRNRIQDGFYEAMKLSYVGMPDVIRPLDGHELMDAIQQSYSDSKDQDSVFIVRSNKRANLYNQNIRSRILLQENELEAGDNLMVVKNNYFWVKPNSDAGFIANGDIVEILRIRKIKELYGFRFAEVEIRMIDYPKMPSFETVIFLDTLTSETPSLTYEENNKLYQEVMADYADLTSNYKKYQAVRKNPFFNALQVKFSYAITCHKSQGGQWGTVFVEQPYLPDGVSKEYLRWLYTAVTRAQKKLYLIGFNSEFFVEEDF
ncbi:MAG TPA: AAA family ATPase [Flavobacteriaceae bacterium]|nr:AAA family ATPase [Flavobacteriaceae bacterium]